MSGQDDRLLAYDRDLPQLRLASGSVEALKWLALVLMTGDHVNKYLLAESVPVLFDAGRVVMPIFAILLGYNLARPGSLASGAYGRVLLRLGVAAAVASLPFFGLGGLGWGWWPLNILAAFWLAAAAMYLIDRGGAASLTAAALLILVGGAFVEFWWAVLVITVSAWSYARRPSWTVLVIGLLAGLSLQLINRNSWALVALPLIVLASRIDLRVPRMRWLFYIYYPAHLGILWSIRVALAD